MSLPSLPALAPEPLPFAARSGLQVAMLALHAAFAWALWQLAPASTSAGDAHAVEVQWIAPPAPAVTPAPQPEPVRPAKPSAPRPAPVPPAVSVAETAPTARDVVVPEPVAPEPVAPSPVEPVAPPAVEAAPAPAVTAPPPPPAPKTVAITSVQYLMPPVLEYPLASRRLREQGRVEVRLLVDARGLPQQAQVVRSSGHKRLDEAALVTVRATRFKPYTENGVPQSFWVVMPLVFELEN
jgi:protein TonB